MAYVDWDESMRVDAGEIDEQHRQLVGMINRLHEAMVEGQGTALLGGIIAGLIDYTRIHFTAEERYFDATGYPDSVAHKAQHAEFVTKVDEFKSGFDEGRVMLSLDVMDFLSEWLVGHIKVSDRAYAPYLSGGARA